MNFRISLVFLLALPYLTACGGSGGGGGGDAPPPTPTTVNVSGQLIAPQVVTETTGIVAQMHNTANLLQNAAEETCSTVPRGYQPLDGASIEAKRADDTIAATFETNSCGEFSAIVPEAVASLHAQLPEYEPLSVDIAVFTDHDQGQLASMLPLGASYQISTLQYLGGSQLAFSVVDTISQRAGIGLPQSTFAVSVNSVDQPIHDISSAAATNTEASVVLVMDASGSMRIRLTSGYNRIDLASIAAHIFIEEKGVNDETAFIIFDSDVSLLTRDNLEAGLPMQDSAGAPVSWEYSDSGFVTPIQPLHRVADAYNSNSRFYGGAGGIALHADSGDVLTSARYPFSGQTALWDGVMAGLSTLPSAAHNRQLIVAMTDGQDNRSNFDVQDAVTQAKQDNVPVHTIGFGTESQVNVEELTKLSTETGGTFQRVEDDRLPDLYLNIQQGIRYQYVIQTVPLNTGDVVTLRIVTGGASNAQKQITVQ